MSAAGSIDLFGLKPEADRRAQQQPLDHSGRVGPFGSFFIRPGVADLKGPSANIFPIDALAFAAAVVESFGSGTFTMNKGHGDTPPDLSVIDSTMY